MMSNAILALEDQAGSSRPEVSKSISKSLPSGSGRSLSVRVKKLAESERLAKAKSSSKVASPTESPALPGKGAPKEQRATRKTRRLSQVETPEALKKATRKRKKAMASEVVGGPNAGKMKRLSEVKTPEGFKDGDKKKTKKTTTPVKRKSLKRASSSKPAKKGRI